MNSVNNPSTNTLSSLSNLPESPDSDVDELDPLVLGASEEVNTSCNDDRNFAHSSKVVVNVESFHPEALGLQRKTPLNSPYIYGEDSNMANDINEEQRSKTTQINKFTDSETVRDTTNENGTNHNVSDPESVITTTVVSEGISLDSARGIVVMEQVALEQINELIASASQMQDNNSSSVEVEDPCDRRHFRSESQNSDSSSTELEISRQSLQEQVSIDAESEDMFNANRFEELDTQEIAEALTNELKKYSIPQAVFARKVLNRSQGTLSDVLRKPKPWNELRGGREIFRKMKEWLDLPEVKRIPQLRTVAALELDAKAKKEMKVVRSPVSKKSRLHFTDSQKRALFAIFKETKKPSREMQNALAEELGLERGTVANFFMNARRRHPEM